MLQNWGHNIDDAVEDLWEEYPDVDRDEILGYIEDVADDDKDDHPFLPSNLEEKAVEEALRRMDARQRS